MSEQIKFYKGLETDLPQENIEVGALYHCTDTGNTYRGINATELELYSSAVGKKIITIDGNGENYYIGEIFNDYNSNKAFYLAHAEGDNTKALGEGSHAEGCGTTAKGDYSHAEGENNVAEGWSAHAEGGDNTATGDYSHAEGQFTQALTKYSHSGGRNTIAGCYGYSIIYFVSSHTLCLSNNSLTTITFSPGESEIGPDSYLDTTIDVSNIYAVGDKFTIFAPSINHYINCGTVKSIQYNMITFEEDLTYIQTEYENPNINTTNSNNYYFFVATKPEGGTGAFELNGVAYAEGEENIAAGENSHAEGYGNQAIGHYSHVEGIWNKAAYASHAEGRECEATGNFSHAGGRNTKALADWSYAYGHNATASGRTSHAEGDGTTASGNVSHAEGYQTVASGKMSHAEGNQCHATADKAHAEGQTTRASGAASHAEGLDTHATASAAHAEGGSTDATAIYAHAEGYNTTASGSQSHAEGQNTTAYGNHSHAEGSNTYAGGNASHTEGLDTIVQNGKSAAHAEGQGTIATAMAQHVEGRFNKFTDSNHNNYLHVLGIGTGEGDRRNGHTIDINGNTWFAGDVTVGDSKVKLATMYDLVGRVKEGQSGEVFNDIDNNNATGLSSHAEGFATTASGSYSHTEGSATYAMKDSAHAEGKKTIANGIGAHAEGFSTTIKPTNISSNSTATYILNLRKNGTKFLLANGQGAHAEGVDTLALETASHAEGQNTIATITGQHVEGRFNDYQAENFNNYLHVLGNGTAEDEYDEKGALKKRNRSNAHTIDIDGNAWFAGQITTGNSKAPHRGILFGTTEPDPNEGVDGDIYILYSE